MGSFLDSGGYIVTDDCIAVMPAFLARQVSDTTASLPTHTVCPPQARKTN